MILSEFDSNTSDDVFVVLSAILKKILQYNSQALR